MYLAFVKFDLICKEFEQQFHDYFDSHVKEWVHKNGCGHGWRTREHRSAPNEGLLEQEFWQIYEIADPYMFKKWAPAPLPTERTPWLRDRSNWGRVFYRILSFAEKDSRRGKYWVRFEFDYKGTPSSEAEFKNDYRQYIIDMTSLPAIHRAWQLEYQSHEREIEAGAAARYMGLFEIDAPENIFNADEGSELFPFKNQREGKLVSVARHFSLLLLDVAAPRSEQKENESKPN